MGIPVDVKEFLENQSVLKIYAFPDSTIKEKQNTIAFHKPCKAQASGVLGIKGNQAYTLSNILTDLLPCH
jgi:hypothetical protein